MVCFITGIYIELDSCVEGPLSVLLRPSSKTADVNRITSLRRTLYKVSTIFVVIILEAIFFRLKAWERAGRPRPTCIQCAKASRIIALPLHFLDHADRIVKILAISAHLPHSGTNYTDDDYITCLEHLDETVTSFDENYIPYIAADLNARIGIRNDHDDNQLELLGPYGIPGINHRGRMVVDFMAQMGLCSLTSFYQSQSEKYGTWQSFKDNVPRQIDFALMRKRDFKRVRRSIVMENAMIASDHLPILTQLKLIARTMKRKEKKNRGTPRDWETFPKSDANVEAYNRSLREEFKKVDATSPHAISSLLEAVATTIEVAIPETKAKSTPWFTRNANTLLPLFEARNKAHRIWVETKTIESREEFRNARIRVKQAVKAAKNEWIESELQQLKEMNVDPANAWKAMYRIIGGFTGHWKKPKEMTRCVCKMVLSQSRKRKMPKPYVSTSKKKFLLEHQSTTRRRSICLIRDHVLNT